MEPVAGCEILNIRFTGDTIVQINNKLMVISESSPNGESLRKFAMTSEVSPYVEWPPSLYDYMSKQHGRTKSDLEIWVRLYFLKVCQSRLTMIVARGSLLGFF